MEIAIEVKLIYDWFDFSDYSFVFIGISLSYFDVNEYLIVWEVWAIDDLGTPLSVNEVCSFTLSITAINVDEVCLYECA